MIIDFHTHAYTDSIAERAVAKLSETAEIESYTNGTLADLVDKLSKLGIDKAVVLPVATKPTQHQTINDWAASINHAANDKIITFGTVHPDAEDRAEEVQRVKQLGLYGIKLHPDYQDCFLFSEKYRPIFEVCEETGLPVIIHMGYDPVSLHVRHAMPYHLAEVSDRYPKLKLVGAHFGGMLAWEEVLHYLAGRRNVWLDTAFISRYIDEELLLAIIAKHGTDRILYGSDCPWSNPHEEIRLIERLPLSDSEKEQIFSANAMELLGLKY